MQHTADRPVFSPSDLNHFLECEHLIQLELRRESAPRQERDAHAELLAAKGLEHERSWLQRFRDQGRVIVEIDGAGERNWERDAERTVAAMRDGAEVIYQGVFVDEGWRGISDFLVRRAGPSGPAVYEAWDTKLARSSRPYFVLQLCFYTEQLARLQGQEPEEMHVILGTGEAHHFRYTDFASYYRAVRRRFLAATSAGRPTYPYPVPHCGLCHHAQVCEDRWHADDHLSQLAGITREQVQRLNDAGMTTVQQLASVASVAGGSTLLDPPGNVGPVLSDRPRHVSGVRIGPAALERLQHQARLQAHHRNTRTHRYDLLPADERSGFRLMPAPSPGDIFFDMEGDPYFEPASGLEYLFGAVTVESRAGLAEQPRQLNFTYFQALSREEEMAAFEQFIDFVHARLKRWPDLHVYHYAAYEITALKRLMSTHATREEELDDLLRGEVFVDLYQVVRQSLRMSHDSYSIKKVRTFFMEGAGKGVVADGGDSILQFEQFRATGDESLLEAIIDYNREDCVSTSELRDWLLERKQEAERAADTTIPWKVTKPREENPTREEEDARTLQRIEALRAAGRVRRAGPSGPAEGDSSELLADLLGYHRREGKPEWWAHFDRQKKALDDLVDDTQAIAYLEPVAGVVPEIVKQSLVYTLEFPDQEYKLGVDGRQVEDPFRKEPAGTLEWIDGAAHRLGLKRGKKRAGDPLPVAICAGKPFDDSAQRHALGRVADAVISTSVGAGLSRPEAYAAALSLLACDVPCVVGRLAGSRLQTLDLEEQKILVAALDQSYLLIQGPPGSGKTWTGARLIVSLIALGKRIGVAATSHKAINNLLQEVEAVALAEGVTFEGLKKGSDDEAFGGRLIRDTDKNEEIEAACARAAASQAAILIAGTAWLFSRPAFDQALDYLFIDEAGQVALADAVALGTAASNVVLLGDPQQLPQVRQGIHPGDSGCSVLEHLLSAGVGATAHNTVSEDRGIFLAQSWRLHPEVCGFISVLSYDGRLTSAPGRDRQSVISGGLTGTGLRYLPVEHSGNSQQSIEEARVVADHIRTLLDGGTFTDSDGQTRPLTPKDILVVAPFNMQVRCLGEQVPEGVEVGTVDKFQGREAPVVFFSMASSTGEDVPRGLEFLFSRNRFNVAISRAKALAVLICSPRLLDLRCRTVDQMRLLNAICRFAEVAESTAPVNGPS